MDILETNRLVLRTIKKDDYEKLYNKVFSDYEVVKNTFGSDMFTKEETFEFLDKNANHNAKTGLSVIVEKHSHKLIGLGGVLSCSYLDTDDYEIGFILEKSSWGKGYAKEIGIAQISQIKNELKKQRALALASQENTSSIKALESLGFKYKCEVESNRGSRLVYELIF